MTRVCFLSYSFGANMATAMLAGLATVNKVACIVILNIRIIQIEMSVELDLS